MIRCSSEMAPFRIPLAGQSARFFPARRSDGQTDVKIAVNYSGAYGMGEKFDSINQKGKTVRNRVVEKFCNQGELTYCSIPFFFTDSGLGVFADTKRETVFSFGEDEIVLTVPKDCGLLVFTGTPREIVSEFTALCGDAVMPPRFAFAPWISANHWDSRKKVERAVRELKENRFPASVLVLEAWSDEATFYIFGGAEYEPKPDGEPFRCEDFTFPPDGPWPDPRGMLAALKDEGLHTVLWQIPAYKKMETGRESRQNELDAADAVSRGLCVMKEDGAPYRIPEGNWFEGSLIPDFTNPATKETWFAKRQYLLDIGVDGFKTDGGEFIYETGLCFANGDSEKEQKNAYCETYVDAYHRRIGKDRVLFSRAGYTGAQCTPILWAGDHESTFAELRSTYTAAMTAAMSGIAYWGFDIGGFAGALPSEELYRRSTQFACFCPVMQWHSEPDGGQFRELMPGAEGNNERSPWNIAMQNNNPAFLDEMRYWHNLRMLLLPYICSEAAKSARDHIPMMRPLFFDGHLEASFQHEDEYFFGESLLVAPILEEGALSRTVYLPDGEWYGLFSGKKYAGGVTVLSEERYPVYLKGGSAVVLKAPFSVLDDPDFTADNRTDNLSELILLVAGVSAACEFCDERGTETVVWSREGGISKGKNSRILRAVELVSNT